MFPSNSVRKEAMAADQVWRVITGNVSQAVHKSEPQLAKTGPTGPLGLLDKRAPAPKFRLWAGKMWRRRPPEVPKPTIEQSRPIVPTHNGHSDSLEEWNGRLPALFRSSKNFAPSTPNFQKCHSKLTIFEEKSHNKDIWAEIVRACDANLIIKLIIKFYNFEGWRHKETGLGKTDKTAL